MKLTNVSTIALMLINKTRRNCPFDLKIGMRIPCIVYFISIGIFFQILTYSSLNIYEVGKCVNNCINANKTRRNCTFDLKIGYEDPSQSCLTIYTTSSLLHKHLERLKCLNVADAWKAKITKLE